MLTPMRLGSRQPNLHDDRGYGGLSIALQIGFITIISKKAHRHSELGNTRPITVLETTYRLFTNMVQKSVADKMATFDLVPESLHAYLQGRSTRDPISIMAAALDYANDTKAPLHCFLADIKACYDCIPFTTLQLAAARFGLP